MLRTLFEIPLALFLVAFAAGWLLMRRAAWQQWFAAADGTCAIAILLGVSALHIRAAGFLVPFGANVLSIAAAHSNGQQMYHAVGGPQLYSLIYGPYTYLIYQPMLQFGDALTAVKVELFVLVAATISAVFLLVRRSGLSWQISLALTGFACAVLLAVPEGVLGVRGDFWVVLALALALLAIEATKPWLAAIMAGLCCGFAIDVKATLVIEALLLLVLLWRRRGIKPTLLVSAVMVATVLAPFATATISLRHYLAWLALSQHRVTIPHLLGANTLFAIFLLAPVLLVGRGLKYQLPETLLFLAALLLAIGTGAKSGGGPWHLWPLLPFALAWTARRIAAMDHAKALRLSSALALAALVVSARYGVRIVGNEARQMTQFAPQHEREGIAELRSLSAQYPGRSIELAPGSKMDDWQSDLRYVLVAAGQPYDVDPIAAAEALKTGPAVLLDLRPTLSRCDILWVVPHNEIPFSTENNNEVRADKPFVFPQTVRAAFLARHKRIASGRFYDLWACQP